MREHRRYRLTAIAENSASESEKAWLSELEPGNDGDAECECELE